MSRPVSQPVNRQAPLLAGVDIGGTKCAVCLGIGDETGMQVLSRRRFLTPGTPRTAIDALVGALQELLAERAPSRPVAIGVSCGGPLDSARGRVLSPPNLPGWDEIDVVSPFGQIFGVPAALQNDANAGALAEWWWGAGRGCRNLIFLTFGTGMGAGLILDGRLYSGTNDMAGEAGHIRLEPDGPVGYGKAGSFEGFSSGGGIAGIARQAAAESLAAGIPPSFCSRWDDLSAVTAERVAEAAWNGDPLAVQIFQTAGRQLGKGLAVLVDLLNPERIIIGGIYSRQRALLEPAAMAVLQEEAIPRSLSVCTVVPAGLSETIGDLASLSVALWSSHHVLHARKD